MAPDRDISLSKGDVVIFRQGFGNWSWERGRVGVFDGETQTCWWLRQGDVLVPVEKVGCEVKVLAKGR